LAADQGPDAFPTPEVYGRSAVAAPGRFEAPDVAGGCPILMPDVKTDRDLLRWDMEHARPQRRGRRGPEQCREAGPCHPLPGRRGRGAGRLLRRGSGGARVEAVEDVGRH